MAIYRGVGGAGDATNDATSQSILAAQAAQAAAVSEANAASSAISAAASAALAQTFEPENFVQPSDLGTAAYAATIDFATATQGALAASALQPSNIGTSVQAYDADLDAIAGSNMGSQIVSYATNGTTFRNRIINGDMRINQRGTGAQVPLAAGVFLADRWVFNSNKSTTFNAVAATASPPAGFTSYLSYTSTGAYSLTAGDFQACSQYIEGFNVADLSWGTANAKAITISFWVKCSLTGTFGGSVANNGVTRSYPFTYTINSANTWEYKTVTIAGDTSGTWTTDNSAGLRLTFSLGTGTTYSGTAGAWASANYNSATGAVNVSGTNGATFYITGVQLEKGSTATSFEYRPYGTELALCQRYCYAQETPLFSLAWVQNSLQFQGGCIPHPVTMRTTPTVSGASSFTIQGYTASAVGFALFADKSYLGCNSSNSNGVPSGALCQVNPNQVPVVSAEL